MGGILEFIRTCYGSQASRAHQGFFGLPEHSQANQDSLWPTRDSQWSTGLIRTHQGSRRTLSGFLRFFRVCCSHKNSSGFPRASREHQNTLVMMATQELPGLPKINKIHQVSHRLFRAFHWPAELIRVPQDSPGFLRAHQESR